MRYLQKVFNIFFLLSATWLQSCVYEQFAECEPEEVVGAAGYLQLAVSTDYKSGTRANPTGGENGDWLEHGSDKENTIHDLTIFVYKDTPAGLDTDSKVIWSKYVDSASVSDVNPDYSFDRIYNVTVPLTQEDMNVFGMGKNGVNLRLFIVANAGDQTLLHQLEIPVKDICQYTDYGNAWRISEGGSPADADYFIMSSAFNSAKRTDRFRKDGVIDFDGEVYSSEVSLERVAARIDVVYGAGETYDAASGLTYANVGGSDNSLRITDIVPVNLMQNNSYLLKHLSSGTDVTPAAGMPLLVAADETTDGTGRPTNYVVSPGFIERYSSTAAPGSYFGATAASYLRNNLDEVLAEGAYKVGNLGAPRDIPVNSLGAGSDGRKTIPVCYANENTNHEKFQITDGDGGKASDYLTGLLFRAQYHPATLYTEGGDLSKTVEYTDGQDFWLFRTVADEVLEKNNLYFASADALNAYVATLPGGGRYESVYYPGGVCYYNIWVKHCNLEDADDNFPMKYGIVRNNIYRISLGFHGIGEPTPEITEPYNVRARIYVTKWNFRPQSVIQM